MTTKTANIGLAIWRMKSFYETFVQGSTAGILLNFCAKTRHIANLQNVSRQCSEPQNQHTKPKEQELMIIKLNNFTHKSLIPTTYFFVPKTFDQLQLPLNLFPNIRNQ